MSKDVYIEDIQKVQYGFTQQNGSAAITLDNNCFCFPRMFEMHSHHMLELSLFKVGAGVYEIGDARYPIQTNDVFVIANTEPHRIVLREGQSVENLVIHFETSFLWNFYGQIENVQFLDVFFNRSKKFSHLLGRENPATQKVVALFHEIEQAFVQQLPYHKLHIKILLETMLLQILSQYDYCAEEDSSRLLSHKDIYQIDEVMNYINFNLEKHLTLQELAQIACVSPAYFSSIFKRYNGVTLFEYITQKRVAYAIQLIKTTNKSLTEIAILCGFNSSTSFNKAFGRITGFVPSFYRKKGSE